jgi:hypothetical protein
MLKVDRQRIVLDCPGGLLQILRLDDVDKDRSIRSLDEVGELVADGLLPKGLLDLLVPLRYRGS